DGDALLIGQARERVLHRERVRDRPQRFLSDLRTQLLRSKYLSVAPARADLVYPRVADDSEQPARELRAGSQLVEPRQRPLYRNLHDVVGVVRIACKRARKAAQPRQQSDDFLT